MKRSLIIIVVGLLAFGLGWWTNERRQFTNGVFKDGQLIPISKTHKSKRKVIRDYISDTQFIRWTANHPDTTSYMCELTLHEITALYWYHGQCGYDYFTYTTSDSTIDVLWSYRSDCILNMSFLEKSNGIKKYPKRGDTFATFTLVNDTTLRVKYYFSDWTKKVNEIVKDSLYPTYYHLMQDSRNLIK